MQDEAVEELQSVEQPKKKKRRRKEPDPMAPRPGRKRGRTALHKTLAPAHLEEVHERLIWDGLESVRAYISQLGYNDPETGECLISINQLIYYRARFITKEERMGRKFLGRFLREFRVRLDAIGAQESAVAIQAKRVLEGLKEEEEAETTIPQVGSDLELLDRMIGRLYKMKQEAGLIPQAIPPTQRVQLTADVKAQTTVDAQVKQASPKEAKEIVQMLKKVLKNQALQAGEEQ